MSDRNEIRRQLGGMPTGEYRMQDMQFSVRHVEPEKLKDPGIFDWKGIVVCFPEVEMGGDAS